MELTLSDFGVHRYEGQMQSQRLRMVSDSELRLEQFQAERKDEKRRYEDALDRLKQVGSSWGSVPHLGLSLFGRQNGRVPEAIIMEPQRLPPLIVGW